MLLYLLEQGEKIDHVVFLDTTIEFRETIQFVKRVDEFLQDYGLEIMQLRPERSYAWYFLRKPIVKGRRKGQAGYGCPYPSHRWCCKVLKRDPFFKFLKSRGYDRVTSFTGLTAEEIPRINKSVFGVEYAKRYGIDLRIELPLAKAGITDRMCYDICKEHDLLNPVYEKFHRQGCVICPYHSIQDWREIYQNYPRWFNLAEKLEKWSIERTGKTFRLDYTLSQLRKRFEGEEKQTKLSFWSLPSLPG